MIVITSYTTISADETHFKFVNKLLFGPHSAFVNHPAPFASTRHTITCSRYTEPFSSSFHSVLSFQSHRIEILTVISHHHVSCLRQWKQADQYQQSWKQWQFRKSRLVIDHPLVTSGNTCRIVCQNTCCLKKRLYTHLVQNQTDWCLFLHSMDHLPNIWSRRCKKRVRHLLLNLWVKSIQSLVQRNNSNSTKSYQLSLVKPSNQIQHWLRDKRCF